MTNTWYHLIRSSVSGLSKKPPTSAAKEMISVKTLVSIKPVHNYVQVSQKRKKAVSKGGIKYKLQRHQFSKAINFHSFALNTALQYFMYWITTLQSGMDVGPGVNGVSGNLLSYKLDGWLTVTFTWHATKGISTRCWFLKLLLKTEETYF